VDAVAGEREEDGTPEVLETRRGTCGVAEEREATCCCCCGGMCGELPAAFKGRGQAAGPLALASRGG